MIRILVLIVAMAAGASGAAAQGHSKADLNAQLKLLMEWLPGDYDNHEQIVRQSGGGFSPATDKPFHRLHTMFRRVNMPAVGEHVIYVEEYRDDDPKKLTRVRLYKFTVEEKLGAIRLHLVNPLKPEALQGAHADLKRVEALTAKDWRVDRDLCDVFINWEGGQFRGAMKEKSCNRPDGSFVDYTLIIGEKHHWVRNRARDPKTNAVAWELMPGTGDNFIEQTKARWFTCVVNHSPTGDMTKTPYLTTVNLHDQGGTADIKWPDGRDLVFQIETRAFTSPAPREFPLFGIHEKSNMAVPIAYAYAVDDAERFGLNLGWFYTLCRLKEQGEARPDR
jgi:hypothetical protein